MRERGGGEREGREGERKERKGWREDEREGRRLVCARLMMTVL